MDRRLLFEILQYVERAIDRALLRYQRGAGRGNTLGGALALFIGKPPTYILPNVASGVGHRLYAAAYDHQHGVYAGGTPADLGYAAYAGASSLYFSLYDHVHRGPLVRNNDSSQLFPGTKELVFTGGNVLTNLGGGVVKVDGTSGGGGIAHSYIGYNTVGGTSFAVTASRAYLKKITIGAAGILLSIGAYLRLNNNGANPNVMFGVWDDVAGVPSHVIAMGSMQILLLEKAAAGHDARWVDGPIGTYLAAGDYWIGVQINNTMFDMYKDGSGSDGYFNGLNGMLSDLGNAYVGAWTAGTDNYSLRASLLA